MSIDAAADGCAARMALEGIPAGDGGADGLADAANSAATFCWPISFRAAAAPPRIPRVDSSRAAPSCAAGLRGAMRAAGVVLAPADPESVAGEASRLFEQ